MIGWYAHHHGRGHLTRARCVTAHLDEPVQVFSSAPDADVARLPVDTDAPRSLACATAPPPDGLHFAPIGVAGLRRRMAQIASWIGQEAPSAFVVDVSVEVAELVRLLSTPSVVVRQHGQRDDPAHLRCYRNATRLLAPYPEWLEEAWVPAAMREQTDYSGGFSRFDGRRLDAAAAREEVAGAGVELAGDERLVVVLTGEGGRLAWPVADAAAATPGWRWVVLGRSRPIPGVEARWADDPFPWLRAADVLVTHAGHNAVMECAAAGRPTIVLPTDRPYDEQRHKARRLHDAGIGVVRDRWPDPHGWAGLLDRTASDPTAALPGLVDGDGAPRAAAAIARVAARYGVQEVPA